MEKLGSDPIKYDELHESQMTVEANVQCPGGRDKKISSVPRLQLRFFMKKDRKSIWKVKLPDEIFNLNNEEDCKVAFSAKFQGLTEIRTASMELPIQRGNEGLMQLSTSTRTPKVRMILNVQSHN